MKAKKWVMSGLVISDCPRRLCKPLGGSNDEIHGCSTPDWYSSTCGFGETVATVRKGDSEKNKQEIQDLAIQMMASVSRI